MKKILVPVDFSPSSKLALEYALTMAERASAGIHVLHAWEVPAYLRPDLLLLVEDVSATLADHVWHEAEKAMKAFLEDAKVTGRSDVTFEVVAGQPLATVMSAIETGTYDFISMGTHGRSGFSHFVLGSVAERVVRHSKLPVLTVQARQGSARMITIKRFLVAIDYSEHSKRAFSMAADLAKEFGASIELLHVWSAPYFGPGYGFDAGAFLDPARHKSLSDTIRENADREMRAFASSIAIPEGVTVATHIESGDASNRILEIIEEKRPDVVVIGTHGRTGPRRWLLGSVAERTIQHSKSPVLVVP